MVDLCLTAFQDRGFDPNSPCDRLYYFSHFDFRNSCPRPAVRSQAISGTALAIDRPISRRGQRGYLWGTIAAECLFYCGGIQRGLGEQRAMGALVIPFFLSRPLAQLPLLG